MKNLYRKANSSRAVIFVFIFLLLQSSYGSLNNTNTDWIKDAKYGIMMHFVDWKVVSDEKWQNLINNFDVKTLADQLEDAGAGYLLLTLGQNSGHYLSPNAAYDAYTGYAPGTKCSTRDLPLDLYNALKPKGIKLMLYIPASPPCQDDFAEKALGFDGSKWNPPINMTNSAAWANVLRTWSDRYGDKISGWWVDGAYDGRFKSKDEMEIILQNYAAAMKHGNPNSIVTFNNGLRETVYHFSDAEDYTAGELGYLNQFPGSRWLDGVQWHALTYIGESWGLFYPRLEDKTVISWIKQITDVGGCITLDAGPSYDSKSAPIGTFSPYMMAQLKNIKSVIRDGGSLTDQKPARAVPQKPAPAKLISQWDFENNATDPVSGNNGTLMEKAGYTTDAMTGRYALELNGSGDYMAIGDPENLRITSQISIAAWIKPDTLGTNNIVAKGHTSNAEISLKITDGTTYCIGSWYGQGEFAMASGAEGDKGKWVHLAGVYNGENWILYKNGQEIKSIPARCGTVVVGAPWAIGARGFGNARYFDGKIDDVRIYSGALSAQQVKAIYMRDETQTPAPMPASPPKNN